MPTSIELKQTDISQKVKICAVDLFCGAGGLTYGLERAGIDVRLGVDIDPACEYPYTTNNKAKFLLKSVENIAYEDIASIFSQDCIKLIAGCAPCQTFSTYNQKATPNDKRWWLLQDFSKIVQKFLPEYVTMENVPRLKEQNVFTKFIDTLRDAQYHVYYKVIKCEDYGIPQLRQRLVLLASRFGPIRLLSPSEFGVQRKTVRESISNMPHIKAGEIDQIDKMHQASSLSPLNMQRIDASTPGSTWRDWKEVLIADCHKKRTGRSYASVYGRMCWDEPAPTITTQFFGFGNGRFGHPEQSRAISLREGAILQSFPNNYKFVAPSQPIYKKSVGRLIGNAVPPILGEVIGQSILKHSDFYSENHDGS